MRVGARMHEKATQKKPIPTPRVPSYWISRPNPFPDMILMGPRDLAAALNLQSLQPIAHVQPLATMCAGGGVLEEEKKTWQLRSGF